MRPAYRRKSHPCTRRPRCTGHRRHRPSPRRLAARTGKHRRGGRKTPSCRGCRPRTPGERPGTARPDMNPQPCTDLRRCRAAGPARVPAYIDHRCRRRPCMDPRQPGRPCSPPASHTEARRPHLDRRTPAGHRSRCVRRSARPARWLDSRPRRAASPPKGDAPGRPVFFRKPSFASIHCAYRTA